MIVPDLVALSSVISVYNPGLYANGRMLHSLAKQSNAPAYLRAASKDGIPVAGSVASSAGTVNAVFVTFLWPELAFHHLMSVATITAIISWALIMIIQMTFRQHIGAEASATLKFKLPFARVAPWVALAVLVGIVILMCFHLGYHMGVFVGPVWVGLLLVCYQIRKRRPGDRSASTGEALTEFG